MTNTKGLLAVVLALCAASSGAAQLYRWVDDKGHVEWRDTPPPAHAKQVEQRNVGGNTIETSTLPYTVQQAMKNFPVTLWTFDCGEPCTQARNHLKKRGVPHTERNPQKESKVLMGLTGSLEVPVLVVGSKQLKGYLESDWDAALDSAGYPKSAMPGVRIKPQSAPKAPNAPDTAAKAPAR
ncbi:MAG: glutaredoxin family protein [Burkholderiales bacterium]